MSSPVASNPATAASPRIQHRPRRDSRVFNFLSVVFAHPAVAPVLILAVGIVFLHPLWTSRGILFSKHSDIIAAHVSLKSLAHRALETEGQLPLWDPSMNAGAPAWGNPEAVYLFPFDLLYYVLPLDLAVNLVVILNVLLAGLAAYLFSREVLDHRVSALSAGIAYMLSYRFLAIVYAGWLAVITMYALTPLLFWACHRAIQTTSAKRITLLALVVALCFLQGGIQLLYYSGLGCGLYALLRLARLSRPQRLRAAGGLIAGVALGVTLAAPAFLPRLVLASFSTRMDASYEFFLRDPPRPADLITALDPLDYGGEREEFWENNFYFGLGLYPLCAIAILGRKRGSWLLLASGLAMIFLCFDTPVLKLLFDDLPGFRLFRQAPRILLLAQFAFAWLGGMGMDALLDAKGSGRGNRWFRSALVTAGGVGVATACAFSSPNLVGASSLLLLAGLAVPSARRNLASLGVGVLCLFPVLDAAIRIGPKLTVVPLSEALPRLPFHDVLRRASQNGRVLVLAESCTMSSGTAGYFDIDTVNGYSALKLKHYREYFAVLKHGEVPPMPLLAPGPFTTFDEAARPDMLRALDVRYALANAEQPLIDLGCTEITYQGELPVFCFYQGVLSVPVFLGRFGDPLGPAYFARSVQGVDGEEESLRSISEARSVLDAFVLGLDRDVPPAKAPDGTARLVKQGINRYEYELDSKDENFLILSQIWYPYWRARLDGRAVRLYQTNHALLGCFVPPGRHHLTLVVESPPRLVGFAMSILAGSFLLAVNIASARRGRSRIGIEDEALLLVPATGQIPGESPPDRFPAHPTRHPETRS